MAGTHQQDRAAYLDGIRGIAAAIVVLYHFYGHYAPGLRAGVMRWTGFELFAGPACVAVFFVLSGFVLVRSAVRGGTLRHVAVAAAKRWPRLAGPVLLAGLMLGVGAYLGIYPGPDQVPPEVARSNYFALYGWSRGKGDVARIVHEGLIDAFADRKPWFNPVLWTMHPELVGSFVAFAVVAARLALRGTAAIAVPAALLLGAVCYSYWLVPFAGGILLALSVPGHGPPLPSGRAAPWIAAALLVFGLQGPDDVPWLPGVNATVASYAWTLVETAAAAAVIVAAMRHQAVRAMLESRPCQILGKLSFPAYLVHFLVLYSLSTWLFLWSVPAPLNLLATLLAVYAAALPLAAFETLWLRLLRTPRPARRPDLTRAAP